MLKTSVYLTEQELARLARIANVEGVSQAEVIRRAIRSYQPQLRTDRNFALAGAADGPGGSAADLADCDLLDGFWRLTLMRGAAPPVALADRCDAIQSHAPSVRTARPVAS